MSIHNLLTSLIGVPRNQKQAIVIASDFFLLALSAWLSYSFRFGQPFSPNKAQWILIALLPVIAFPIFLTFGLYRAIIRYVGNQALWAIVKSVSFTTLFWSVAAFMTQMTGAEGVPRTVPLIFWFVAIAVISGSRFFARFILSLSTNKKLPRKPALIYGAGTAGRQLAASLRKGNDLLPVGFVDDDPRLGGKEIDGLRIYGPNNLESIISKFGVETVIVTLDSASQSRKKEVVTFLEKFSLRVRILPSVSSIAQGRHLVNMIREVDIGDLLGRDPVSADPVLLSKCIQGKSVLVTGAGGSIGSELCRQITALNPSKLILLEANEGSLFQIHRALVSQTEIEIIPCLGSVTNRRLVSSLLKTHKVETIYHAAAHKHVPLIESNLFEGVRNNVLGTLTLGQLAYQEGVNTFVLISTDKAVRPTSVMGATKRMAELIIQNLDLLCKKNGRNQFFCAVRFGNVLGSSGSVVPIFKEQIAQGGPVTVTHPEVNRYFMSVHEAVELVIQAGSLAEGGDIFLLDMGEPVKITDLARNMIRLAGFKEKNAENPDGDIEISFTGLRPGEKLFEELLIGASGAKGTVHPKILKALEPQLKEEELTKNLSLLRAGILYRDTDLTRNTLLACAGLESGSFANSNVRSSQITRLAKEDMFEMDTKPTLPC